MRTIRTIFLDRDGVINRNPKEHDYVKCWSEFELLPDVSKAIKVLTDLGWQIIVITNQRGVARGLVKKSTVNLIHSKLNKLLKANGTMIKAFYWCAHDIEDHCQCRKPLPGLIIKAAKLHHSDLSKSWLIGDSETDKLCAENAGVKFKFILTNSSLLLAVKEIVNEVFGNVT